MSSWNNRWEWWEYAGLIIVIALSICLVAAVTNAIFDDSPKPPKPLNAEQQCIKLGGVPLMNGYELKDCQFKEGMRV